MNILTARAMQLTGADRVKFNQAIADGHYRRVPKMADGKSRRFSDDDILGLATFTYLLELGVKVPLAASWANDVTDHFREQGTDLVSVHIVRSTAGEIKMLPYYGEGNDKGRGSYQPDGKMVLLEIVIPVENIMADLYRKYRELHQSSEFKDEAE